MPYSGFAMPVGFWHTDEKWNFDPFVTLKTHYENGTCNLHELRSVVIPIVTPDAESPARLRILLRDRPVEGANVLADDAPLRRLMKLPACRDDATRKDRGQETWCLKDHVHQLGRATIFPSVLAHQVMPWPNALQTGPRVSLNMFSIRCTIAGKV